MRFAIVLIPFILASLLVLSNRMGVSGSIVPPGITVDVQERIAYHAAQWRLETALVKAFAKVESNFNPRAKNPSDPSYGLMQITPALAYDYGGLIRNWRDPSILEIEMIMDINNNLSVACWFLDHLSKYPFQQMVMSYNVGETGYKNGVRNWDYFDKVRGHYEKYS